MPNMPHVRGTLSSAALRVPEDALAVVLPYRANTLYRSHRAFLANALEKLSPERGETTCRPTRNVVWVRGRRNRGMKRFKHLSDVIKEHSFGAANSIRLLR